MSFVTTAVANATTLFASCVVLAIVVVGAMKGREWMGEILSEMDPRKKEEEEKQETPAHSAGKETESE